MLSRAKSTAYVLLGRRTCGHKPRHVPAAIYRGNRQLLTETDAPARVVIDERTGTIVIGRDVQISTVAVAHGN